MHPQLTKISEELDEAATKAKNLVSNMRPDEMRLRPDLDCWSVAECLEHLSLTSEAMIKVIADASTQAWASNTTASGPFQMDFVGRLLNWRMRPPARIKTRTSERFQPDIIEPLEDLLPRFLLLQEQLKTEIVKADGLDLNAVRVQSPLSSRVNYNLLSCFQLIVTHQHRHLWQAENTRKAIVRDRLVEAL